MPIREIKVHDGPFPSFDDMMFGDPETRVPFPKEVWADQMAEGEIALFCVDGKTGLALPAEDGRPRPRSEEVCRVSSDMAELKQYAREIVNQHPGIVCVLRAKNKRVIKRIQNRKLALQFSFVYGFLFAVLVAVGSAILYSLYSITDLARSNVHARPPALAPIQWVGLLLGGAVVGILLVGGYLWLSIKQAVQLGTKRSSSFQEELRAAFTPEETLRFKEADRLYVSTDPDERRRGRQLAKEYHYRLQEIIRSRQQRNTNPPNPPPND